MAIVPVGKVNVQAETNPENGEAYFEKLYSELNRNCGEVVARSIGAMLEQELDGMLKRKRHHRYAGEADQWDGRMKCGKCGSQKREDFRRNGHYRRGLDTSYGHLTIEMPQVECQCGGGVRVKYQTLQSRQRIWKDLEIEFRNASGYGMNLRQIKDKYDGKIGGSLGLRTINSRICDVSKLVPIWQQTKIEDLPSVVRVDGIWITLMKVTGEYRQDKQGRRRKVKKGKRIPILVAQGIWPERGRQEVIGWVIADGEDHVGWSDLFFQLRQKGLILEDLRLLIADGSAGLEALRQKKFPNVPFQRCVFHKLKNIWRDLKTPQGLDYAQAHEEKLKVIRHAAQIWKADTESEAWSRMRAFSLTWQNEQPKAVDTLQTGFEWTLSFYQVLVQAEQAGQHWSAALFRTTSQLERENRNIRRRLDRAVVFHSEQGLAACFYLNQVFCQSMRTSSIPAQWSQIIQRQLANVLPFLN
jgi:putative transposase